MVVLGSLAGALALFAAMWPISVARKDASMVALLWAPSYLLILGGVWLFAGQPTDERMLVILALAAAWTLRLAVHMTGRKLRESHEDPRYTALRNNRDPGFWWKSFFIVFCLQAAVQWVLTLPAQMVVLSEPKPLEVWEWAFVAIAAAGFLIEAVADSQLEKFRRTNPRDALCQDGLWAWSRHPNYFGELIFWWAVWALAAPAAGLWTVIAPLLLTFLIRYVSGVPILEKHLANVKRGYDGYRTRTPAFFPRRPSSDDQRAIAARRS